MRLAALALAALVSGAIAAPAAAQNIVRTPAVGGSGLILESATVKSPASTVYVSGQMASALDPANPAAGHGDTKTQVISALGKIEKALQKQGMEMSDVVRLTLYVVADPKLGKPDYAGMNEGFRQFFMTQKNPNTVARSAFEIAGLQLATAYVEIDAVAAK